LKIFKDVPANAVYVGTECDGSKIYVGRANHSGDLLVAKVVPGSRVAKPGTRGLSSYKQANKTVF
jgi:hypothetical protein